MRVRIIHIDFIRGEIAIELNPAIAGEALKSLDGFLHVCRERGLEHMRVCCRLGMSNLQMLLLRELCQRHKAQLELAPDHVDKITGPERLTSTSSHAGDKWPGALEYQFRAQTLADVVGRVATTTILIGLATALDETSRGHLRLFAYELAMNCVEHGSFGEATPDIRMDITMTDTGITVSYRDNANIFMTGNHLHLDVDRKIAEGDKRGLGLFIMNRLARTFDYRRLGEWNVTTLTMNAGHDDAHEPQRRHDMQVVTVEVIPCELPGAVILKPTGSIDSTSTQLMESQIDSLIEKNHSRIVIDFSNVDFISSAGVGIFLGTVSRLRSEGGDLFFMNMPKHIEDVFDIINLKSYFTTIESIDQIETADRS